MNLEGLQFHNREPEGSLYFLSLFHGLENKLGVKAGTSKAVELLES